MLERESSLRHHRKLGIFFALLDKTCVLRWLSLDDNNAEQSPEGWQCPLWAVHSYDLEELSWERGWEETDLQI